MDDIRREDLIALASRDQAPRASVFLPTHRAGAEIQEDPIRLKNLLREAESRLTDLGMRTPEAKETLQPAEELLEAHEFWQHQSDGLAVFASPGEFLTFRVPLELEELVLVGGRYHIKPLLKMFTGDGRFHVLALSQNEIRLMQGTHYGMDELQLENVPSSLAESLKYDVFEKSLQLHTRSAGGAGRRPAVFHGHGATDDDPKEKIFRYFRQIDSGLHEVLKGSSAPLVVAGVDYLLPIYREANTYPHLMEEGVTGNPEGWKPQELHDHAWEIVGPHFRKGIEAAADRYRELQGTGLASTSIEEALVAATTGRIDTLFVPVHEHVWGAYDEAEGSVEVTGERSTSSEDLLDLAAVQTLSGSGTVYAVDREEMPGEGAIAAIYRY